MSIHYWGVIMRGVSESSLDWKNEDLCLQDVSEDYGWEILVDLPNGKKVPLVFEPSEDDNFLGFSACYPWSPYGAGLVEKDVDDALVKVLQPYVTNTEEEIRKKIDYINTYNCC